MQRSLVVGSTLILLVSSIVTNVFAAPIGDPAFHGVWERTDQPVASGQVVRTWMWGPEAHSEPLPEPYLEAPNGVRTVQYFDKSRMEITNPAGDPDDPWHVTNGLLANELMTGRMQVGDNSFEQYEPANVQIAGDPDPGAPTYRMFGELMDEPATAVGTTIVATIDSSGMIGSNQELAVYGITAEHYVELTQHTVASVFWAFMNSSGIVFLNGSYVHDAIFESPFFAVGLPKTAAYWVSVKVGGVEQWVMVQCFERRCLTYTPGNPAGWEVEAGNIGQHYHDWRYVQLGLAPHPPQPSGEGGWRIQAKDAAGQSFGLDIYYCYAHDRAEGSAVHAVGVLPNAQLVHGSASFDFSFSGMTTRTIKITINAGPQSDGLVTISGTAHIDIAISDPEPGALDKISITAYRTGGESTTDTGYGPPTTVPLTPSELVDTAMATITPMTEAQCQPSTPVPSVPSIGN